MTAAPLIAQATSTPRWVFTIPGLRLVSLTNGAQFARFETKRIRDKQRRDVGVALNARSLRCPFTPPLDVTIVRCAPVRMDSDNAVAAAKYVRDQVAEWLKIDDRHDDLVRYRVEQQKTARGIYAVRIVIEPRRMMT